jgi:DNA-directed RNA polymerase I, II, and III subunit RPABC1
MNYNFNIYKNFKKMDYERFSKIQNVLFEMMADRNYLIPDTKRINKEDFSTEKPFHYIFSKRNGTSIICFLCFNNGIDVSVLNNLHETTKQLEIRNVIYISDKITPPAKKTIANDIVNLGVNITIFNFSEMEINKTKHELVPKHILLIKEKEEELLKAYKITKNQLPKIYTTDPIVKYYGWNVGQIVKIIRKNGSVYYRCIVLGL